jgi:hypothetical protein
MPPRKVTKHKLSPGLKKFNLAVDKVLKKHGITNRKALYAAAKREYKK